jgi:hypothetical protein
MGRLRSLLILLLVLTTGSALTLACAFVCEGAQAAKRTEIQTTSHCHGGAVKFPDGEGFRPAHEVCPVMEALHGSDLLTLQSVAKVPVSGVTILPYESSLLSHARGPGAFVAQLPARPPPRPAPPFLRNLVLRL